MEITWKSEITLRSWVVSKILYFGRPKSSPLTVCYALANICLFSNLYLLKLCMWAKCTQREVYTAHACLPVNDIMSAVPREFYGKNIKSTTLILAM